MTPYNGRHWLPHLIRCISGSRCCLFLAELGTVRMRDKVRNNHVVRYETTNESPKEASIELEMNKKPRVTDPNKACIIDT